MIIIAYVLSERIYGNSQTYVVVISVHHKAKVEDVLDLAYVTTRFATIEGGSYGGMLNDISKNDLQVYAPEISNYTSVSDSIIWFYEFQPSSIKIAKNWIDGVSLEVSGTKTKDGNIYIAKINPKLKTIPYRILCN